MHRRRRPAQRWQRAEGAGAFPARDQAQVPAHLTIAQDNEDPTALATTLGSRTRPAGRRRPARPAPGGDCAPGRGKALLNQCRAPRQSPRSRSAPQSRSAPSPQRSQSTKDNRLIRCRSPPESVGWEPDRVCRLGGGRPSDCVCTQYYRRQSRSALIPTEARIQRGRRVGVSVPRRALSSNGRNRAKIQRAGESRFGSLASFFNFRQKSACMLLGAVLRGCKVRGRRGFIRRRAAPPPAPAWLRFVISSSAPRLRGSVCAPVSDAQRPGPAPA